MLSEMRSSKGRSHAVEAPHTRRHNLKPEQEFPFKKPQAAPALLDLLSVLN
jgi:hypothetical protein